MIPSETQAVCVVNSCNFFLFMSMSDVDCLVNGKRAVLNLYCVVHIGVHEG